MNDIKPRRHLALLHAPLSSGKTQQKNPDPFLSNTWSSLLHVSSCFQWLMVKVQRHYSVFALKYLFTQKDGNRSLCYVCFLADTHITKDEIKSKNSWRKKNLCRDYRAHCFSCFAQMSCPIALNSLKSSAVVMLLKTGKMCLCEFLRFF